MYSASVGIGGLVGSRPIWSYSFLSAHESIAFADDRDQCALASVDDPRPQLDKVQIEAIELVFGEDNALAR